MLQVYLEHFCWDFLGDYPWFGHILKLGLLFFSGRRFTGNIKHTQIGPEIFLFNDLRLKGFRNNLFIIDCGLSRIWQKACELIWEYSAPWFLERPLRKEEWRHVLLILVKIDWTGVTININDVITWVLPRSIFVATPVSDTCRLSWILRVHYGSAVILAVIWELMGFP